MFRDSRDANKVFKQEVPTLLFSDYSIAFDKLERSIKDRGFRGYRVKSRKHLSPDIVFGMSWNEFEEAHRDTISRIHCEWGNPFLLLLELERADGFNEDHGPMTLELLFARCEAIATYISAFSSRKITPQCLVHIRSGVAFGGNFSDYPKRLSEALRHNDAGLPKFMLFDRMGSDRNFGDYLDLVEKYRLVERWSYPDGGYLALAILDNERL